MKNKIQHTTGSGNVFKDIGLDNPEERLKKAQIASAIYGIIQKRELTQIEAGKILGLRQPKVSALINGRLDGFSMDRLLGFLNKLGQDIEIIVQPKKKQVPSFVFSFKTAKTKKKLKTAG
ncbi:MAG: XRE family transcriptional regulator [Desulfobacula sp.]|jgi:predicted XRE-type DNA-binding protein|uniref:helix-turn-helix domain-containing protein n=1 Tax=Desulfobacula sp. TaxID=2593537 RepID=UPI001DC2839B|nr:XRE family transcriptional regulator [Desulfobacteraceae bacterium]MBT4639474.1 XRE family transcriptional regulator [Deltaproteobacteria bacterium]MBT6751694.1 XRE family transcriptional regulator [Desulfobacula sp.]MBT6499294.1 XRE family transcriptional regulator [Deltaproteobacteria bacterium]MBT7632149.1 XRE family transcriptional regulator [Desulfobacula sp.]